MALPNIYLNRALNWKFQLKFDKFFKYSSLTDKTNHRESQLRIEKERGLPLSLSHTCFLEKYPFLIQKADKSVVDWYNPFLLLLFQPPHPTPPPLIPLII